jgi:hypothetical protein
MARAPRAACALALACACGSGSGDTASGQDTGADTGASGSSGSTGPVVVQACGVPNEMGEPSPHSYLDPEDGRCYCEDGYTWTDPFNPHDFGCTEVGTRDGEASCGDRAILITCTGVTATCGCAKGDTWCSRTDEMNTSCCRDDAQKPPPEHDPDASTNDTGSGTSGPDPGTTTTPVSCGDGSGGPTASG